MAEQTHINVNRAFTANNDPASGALAYFYESGTTTPLTVYSDEGLTTPHASPLVADSEGVFDPVYVGGSVAVKVNVTSSTGATLTGYPIDPVMLDGTTDSGAGGILFTPTTTNTATDVQTAIENNDTAIQALEANILNPFSVLTTTGSGDAFTLTATTTITAYTANSEYTIKFDRAPTGAATLNIDGVGAKDIKKYDAAGALADIAANDWIIGQILKVNYDGTRFVIEGPLAANETTQGLVEKSTSAENAAGTATGKYPDVAGVVEVMEGQLNVSGTAPTYACRAWVNFNGTGTIAIRASGNVASLTDNGTGDYTVTFTTAMPDADYAVTGMGGDSGGSGLTFSGYVFTQYSYQAAGSVRVINADPGEAGSDATSVNVAIFR